ncbi:hypothetical protein GF327_03255 [Candidatus Woesearchaeota archaeon]|nr:hypothetical protein [Candidatus Woesearchaeota archaeon]
MAYAIDIIEDSFNKTKKLLFPIRKSFWLKMGFVSLFSGRAGSGSYSSGYNSNQIESFPEDVKSTIGEINNNFLFNLKKYGYFIGIFISLVLLIVLFFSYIFSIFKFMFIQGVLEKKINIKRSFNKNKKLGASLFVFRIYLGLISIGLMLLIFSPLIFAFLNGALQFFNYLLLIPMLFSFFILIFIVRIVNFIVMNFLVIIMYNKDVSIRSSWNHFKKITSEKKVEIFLFWIMKIVLGIVGGIAIAIIVIGFLIAFGIIGAILAFIFYFMYAASNSYLILGTGIVFGVILFLFFIYAVAVVSLPVDVFFQYYSINMIKKLEKGKN